MRVALSRAARALLARRIQGVSVQLRATAVVATAQPGGDGPTHTVTAHGSALLLPQTFHAATTGPLFKPGSATLNSAGDRLLARIASRLKHIASIRCEGYVASQLDHSSAFGKALSLARARVACAWLRAHGVHAPTTAVGRGKSHPRASTTTKAGRAANRRFELTIRHRASGG